MVPRTNVMSTPPQILKLTNFSEKHLEHMNDCAWKVAREDGIKFYLRITYRHVGLFMPANTIPPPSIFHMLEKNVGKKVLVIQSPNYGFEGTLTAITHEPPGVWLSNAEAVIFRSTIANPIPQIAGREEKSEIFLNLNSVQRIEVLHEE